jgi:hypothetical protein
MGQFSVEKPVAPGSALSGNQHTRVRAHVSPASRRSEAMKCALKASASGPRINRFVNAHPILDPGTFFRTPCPDCPPSNFILGLHDLLRWGQGDERRVAREVELLITKPKAMTATPVSTQGAEAGQGGARGSWWSVVHDAKRPRQPDGVAPRGRSLPAAMEAA